MTAVHTHFMNWIIKNFLRGLIIVVPISITLYIIYEAFITLDRLITFQVPGTGIAVILAAIIMIGFLASNFFIRRGFDLMELVFTRAPIVRIIYAAIKDLLEAFVGDKRRFDKPVAVSFTAEGDVRTLGFVTQDDLAFIDLPGYVYVYLPFAYSMAGSVVVVPATRVQALHADSASVMALVVSGGVSRTGFRI
jgi:uncharacterized membrane protein